MDVQLSRYSSEIRSDLSGNCYIHISVHSKNEKQRLALDSDERSKWRELYPDIRKKHDQIRVGVENKLRDLNYEIDVNYRNPDEQKTCFDELSRQI